MDTIIDNPGFSAFKADKKISFIRGYDPKAIGIDGYRHCVVRYRDVTKGVSVKPAKMVTIPQVLLDENYLLPDNAQKVLIDVVESEQDSIIRSLIDTGASMIDWDAVTLEKCFDSLTALRVSKRLTKEEIQAWAKVALADDFQNRANAISIGKNHSDTQRSAQLAATTNRYVELYSRLSAPVPNLDMDAAKALQSLLSSSTVSDDISGALRSKLQVILNPVAVETGDL